MKSYYYLHVWALQGSANLIKSDSLKSHAMQLRIDAWPKDEIFLFTPFYFVTERLHSILACHNLTGIRFEKVSKLTKEANFKANYPGAELPPFYWLAVIEGQILHDDFAIWDDKYLVVSQKALDLLRDNHVTHSEADEIEGELEAYFKSDRIYFWMPTSLKEWHLASRKEKEPPK
jgi:hypothetical protein